MHFHFVQVAWDEICSAIKRWESVLLLCIWEKAPVLSFVSYPSVAAQKVMVPDGVGKKPSKPELNRVTPSFAGLIRDSHQAQRHTKRHRYITDSLISSKHRAIQVTSPGKYATELPFIRWAKTTHARENGEYSKSISTVPLGPLRPSGRQVVLLSLQELLRTYTACLVLRLPRGK